MSESRTSPKYRSLSDGYPTPNEAANSVANDFYNHRTQKLVMGVYVGLVVDSWPESNSCIVMTAYENKIRCSYASISSAISSGITTVAAPAVGSFVIYCKASEADYGLIIGSVTPISTSIKGSLPSTVTWGDYSKTFAEMASASTFECEDLTINSGNIISQQNPIPGETSSFSENSVGWMHGKLYYRTQAGPLACITLNSIDDFVDMMAHNLQISSSAFKLRSICDYGRSNLEILIGSSMVSFAQNQEANSRFKIKAGWLASGISVQASSGGAIKSDVWSDELGTVSVKSLAGGWIQKVNGIYVPGKQFESDDPSGGGDKEVYEDSKREGFDISAQGQHPAAFGCQARDYVAWQTAGKYRFERYSPYSTDWEMPSPESGGVPNAGGSQYAGFPMVDQITSGIPDEPEDVTNIRGGEAFCGTLPDGSVVLRDAWGSSIELRGGKIVITNMKETEIICGKNFVVMSGKDVIVNGKNTIEVNATYGNLRARSGTNMYLDAKRGSMHLTAMNSGSKPEVREKVGDAYVPVGIVMKCNNQITSIAPYFSVISTNTVSVMGPEDGPSPIIFTKASETMNWSNGSHYIYVSPSGGNISAATSFSNGIIRTGAQFRCDGHLYSKGSVYAERDIWGAGNFGVNGTIASLNNGPNVMSLERELKIPDADEKESRAFFASAIGGQTDSSVFKSRRGLYEPEDYDWLRFHYRTTKNYGTEGHVWFESPWQRQYSDALSEWDHTLDVDKDREMLYPGKLHFESLKQYTTYQESNVFPDGTPKAPQNQSPWGGTFDTLLFKQMKF